MSVTLFHPSVNIHRFVSSNVIWSGTLQLLNKIKYFSQHNGWAMARRRRLIKRDLEQISPDLLIDFGLDCQTLDIIANDLASL